jgi:hypothetical protein
MTAVERIRGRDFVGWRGLPADLAPADLGAAGDPSAWGVRRLGAEAAPARFRPLSLDGYLSAQLSVRDDRVILFDGVRPQLDFAALAADLGEPDERLDFVNGLVPIPGGEWVFAGRGITVFVNKGADKATYVVLYAPTTAADYRARLRPDLAKTPRSVHA